MVDVEGWLQGEEIWGWGAVENLINGCGEAGIEGLNKGMFVRIEREEIRERLKRLNLVIIIKKYWQMVECIFF